MRITLISLDQELYCAGIRILSTGLRQAGYSVQCLFLPPPRERAQQERKFQRMFSPNALAEAVARCANSDLIGLSLMTNQFLQAVSLTQAFKQRGITAPIIWGGIQPTVEPEVCLEFADIVCIGDGEEALLELAECMEQARSASQIRNLWFRLPGQLIRNPVRPLIQNLDALPLPDYSCENHYLLCGDHLEPLTPRGLAQFEGERFRAEDNAIDYPVMTSRGCVFACAFCCNNGVYENLYPHQKRLRWRSVGNVIQELQMIQHTIAPIRRVVIVDDNFTARNDRDLAEFCERYHAEINLPFACQCSPLTITENKMEMLLRSGCIKITMGVETGSARVAEMYNRRAMHAAVPTAIALIEKHRARMAHPPTYQFIIDNPYETLHERLETLRLAVSLPRPWDNPIYSLMLYPGTLLYERADRDGLITDKTNQVYGRNWLCQSQPFFQIWVRLYRANFSPVLLHFLLWPWLARLMTSRVANWLFNLPFMRWLWNPAR